MNNNFSQNKVACLINPKAANSKWLKKPRLHEKMLSILGCEVYDAFDEPRTITDKAKELCRESGVIVAMGGDGTVADIIQGVMESGRADRTGFSVIPFGSGNGFRSSFGIPRNTGKAMKLLKRGMDRKIDLLETCGRYGAFSSIGATAYVTGEKLKNPIYGLWGHLLAGVKLFVASRAPKTVVLEDGVDRNGTFKTRTFSSPFLDCVISKTNYFGYKWLTAPGARLDDGYLDINIFEISPFFYILFFPFIYFGVYQKTFGRHYKARRAVISGKDIHIQINGEYIGCRDEVIYRVVPRALNMIMPDTRKARRFLVNKG